MKGVSKYYPSGEASVQALIAGNDMLCLPENVPAAIDAIKTAIDQKRLKWSDIDNKLKKVLYAKYQLGLSQLKPVDTNNLLTDLNTGVDAIRKREETNADSYYLHYKDSTDKSSILLDSIKAKHYDKIIVGVHNYALRPANNYGISSTAIALWDSLQQYNTATFVFGNVYAAQNFLNGKTLV